MTDCFFTEDGLQQRFFAGNILKLGVATLLKINEVFEIIFYN